MNIVYMEARPGGLEIPQKMKIKKLRCNNYDNRKNNSVANLFLMCIFNGLL